MRKLTQKEFKLAVRRLSPEIGEEGMEWFTPDRCRYIEQSHQIVAVDDDGDNKCRIFVFDIDGEKNNRPVMCVIDSKAYAVQELAEALCELGDEMIWFHKKLSPLYDADPDEY